MSEVTHGMIRIIRFSQLMDFGQTNSTGGGSDFLSQNRKYRGWFGQIY